MKATDLVIIASVAMGAVLGALIGSLIGEPRTAGAVGAMVGLVIGCVLATYPPRSARLVRSGPLRRRRG